MANNPYRIIISDKRSGGTGTGSTAGNSPVSDTSGSTTMTDSGSESKSYAEKSAASAKSAARNIFSAGTAVAVANKLVSYEINTVSLRTGATEYEQKLQFGYSTAMSVATPLIAGAVTGGLPGALIGLAFSGIMFGITTAQNQQTIEYNKQLENISIGMANVRAGVTGSR